MADETSSGAQALERLRRGNERFLRGQPAHPQQSRERREALARTQQPVAVILACSDSRVPPEIVFDQGLGDLFVIRTAGNVADDVALGSIEYAVHVLGVSLLLVLGHQRCGAVTAAVQGDVPPGRIGVLLRLVAPAVRATSGTTDEHIANAVAANARLVAEGLVARSGLLRQAQRSGALTVASAVYSLDTGEVRFL